MDIENMFILLVHIVLVTLMLAQAGTMLGYFYAIVFTFVQVVLFVLLFSTKRFDVRSLYQLLTLMVGFLFLVLYLVQHDALLTFALGYLLVAALFISLVLFSFTQAFRKHPVEVYHEEPLKKPRPPKKNVFVEMEQKSAKQTPKEKSLKKQAAALIAAEKKLSRITDDLKVSSTGGKKKTVKKKKKTAKKKTAKSKKTKKKKPSRKKTTQKK